MLTIPNPASGGNDWQTPVAEDTYGLSQDDPQTSWRINLGPILGQVIAVMNAAKQAHLDRTFAEMEEAAYARQKAQTYGYGEQPKRKQPKKVVLPRFAPQPLDWPPGVAGEIAQYVYQAAMRPVKEVAVVAALGLLAGICGRQWQIPKSGLNLYIVLVARSGVGKEALHSGIGELIKACQQINPTMGQFIDFTEYASGPALTKGLRGNQCFVNVSGELGRRFKRLADGTDPALQTLRTQMTNLYQKSAPSSIVGGLGYSATDNNVESLNCVAYSLIGETTPGTFLAALTESMMEDGFLSRFSVIEYTGDRPEQNRAMLTQPPAQLVSKIAELASQAQQLGIKDGFSLVRRSAAAGAILDLFNTECDANINATNDESKRQMWNRAHMKVLRIAALLAVADNHMHPVITLAQANWAINLVLLDITAFTKRLESGDVGGDDDARTLRMATLLREYLLDPVPDSYKVPEAMRANGIVPRSYLQTRLHRHAAFKNHKLGPTRAMDDTLHSMIGSGYLMELDKAKVGEAYNYHGLAFRIVNLPDADATT